MITGSTMEALAQGLAQAHARGTPAGGVDLTALARIVEYTPEDLTITAETGLSLAALQDHVGQHGQWLPVDPPNPERLCLADLIAGNPSGPRRLGYGTLRDYLLGIKLILPDGRLIRCGGRVVKNVAGYDMVKLFLGSHHTLGVAVEATFKLLPRPEREIFLQAPCGSATEALVKRQQILESNLAPVVLDLHHLRRRSMTWVLGMAGSAEQVAWQETQARTLGWTEPGSLEHETHFWNAPSTEPIRRWSILPSHLDHAITHLGDLEWIARAGNGILYYRGGSPPPSEPLPRELLRRVKETFDPKGILAPLPW